MTPRISAANKVAVLFAAVAIGAVGFAASAAVAQTTSSPQKPSKESKRHFDSRGRVYYGPSGPNVAYQQGPTRIFVTKRSWLDAGTEVLPGDRKFTDYAFPPELGYPSFARENNNRPIDRGATQPAVGHGRLPVEYPAPVLSSERRALARLVQRTRDEASAYVSRATPVALSGLLRPFARSTPPSCLRI